MEKKNQESSGKKNSAKTKWADSVTIAENPNHNGIELRFNAEPSHELQSKLRATGFRPSKSQNMWYADNSEENKTFASEIESVLPTLPEGPELFLSPSFEAVKTNIEQKDFSYILITLKDGEIKSYIVFEPSKPKAEVMASQFAKQEFGENFIALAVKPRTQLREARVLFDEGKIIFPNGQKIPNRRESAIKGSLPVVEQEEGKVPTTTERMLLDKFYKWATLQEDLTNRPSNISRELFDKWFKDHYPELNDKNLENLWQSHSRIMKSFKRLEKRSSGKGLMQPYSSIYKKLMKVIPDLLKHIQEGKYHGKSEKDPDSGLMNLNYDFVTKDKNGNYIIALSHNYEQNGDLVPDPDMQIRIYSDQEIAEAMTFQDYRSYQEVYPIKDGKEYVNTRLKKDLNQFLSQWLTNIINQGHTIDLSKEEAETDVEEWDENLSSERPTFNPVAVARMIKDNEELLVPWKRRKEEKVLDGNSFTKAQYNLLNATFGAIILMDAVNEEKYKTIYNSLSDDSFTISDAAPENHSFKRLHTPEEEKEIIEQFLAQGFQRPFSAQDAFDHQYPVIDVAFRYDTPTEYFTENIEEPNMKKVQKLRKDLKELKGKGTNEKREKLKTEIDELTAQVNKAEQLINDEADIFHDDLFQLILDKAKEKGHHLEGEDEISQFREYMMNNILDNRAIENYHRQPLNELVDELIDEHFNQEKKTSGVDRPTAATDKTKVTDLKSGDTFVPNVLIPAETQEPFYSHLFQMYDMKEILKNNFPHLLKLNNKNLSSASPIALFELMQFGHPSEYGIDVNRQELIKEFEKRGKSIFQGIGYPTDKIYPYVNLYLGYESIEPLNEMLYDHNKDGDEWWAIAEHARPIADVKKAVKLIDKMIEKEKQEMKTYLNPKTSKPKLEYKQQARDIEHTIENLEDSKQVLQHFLGNPPEAETEAITENDQDPLANESGVYTKETAGKNYEEIEIPMPKGAQFKARIFIAKTSHGDFKVGLQADKKFGDHSGIASPASIDGQSYSTKEEALKDALKQLELRLDILIASKDSILGNEEKKNKQLNMALDALKEFAEENNIVLENNPATTSGKIIKGLESTYWTKEDNEYPVNKTVINGMKFHQARLREAIGAKLEKLPIATLNEIVKELTIKFKERRPLSTYDKSLVTIGKTGDKRKATLIASYVDDMILDNDTDKSKNPVMTFLVELLFSGEQKLVDLPQDIEKPSVPKAKKQSQFDLNKEIESFIDKKDKEGSYFNAEEKNYIRQYTGSGGLLKEGATGRGALYEYYTPEVVVQKMWGMAKEYGYDGGSVLEPAVGTGNFLKYAPKGAIVFGFETNHYSARIAQVLYPHAHIHEKAFESLFFAGNIHLKDKFDHPLYSLVIGNPPYGEFTGKYAGMGEKQHTGATEYDQYFILRGLDLLKKNGLLVFLIPSSFMSNSSKFNKVKEKIAAKADFVDCYRLPSRIFETTDIGTDILVLRKNK